MLRRSFNTAAIVIAATPLRVLAQEFPRAGKPVRILVGFAPGGPTDIQARALANEMAKVLEVPVIVENKPGASGGIGAVEVARSEPDGHTLMYISDGVVTQNPHTLKSTQYNALKDFTPVARLTTGGVVLVSAPSLPVKTLKEFIAYGKSHPGQLAYASFGAGTVSHIYGEVLRMNTGIDMVHVPYKGSADALKDLLAGRVHVMFDAPSTAVQYAKDGRLRILGTAGTARRGLIPDVPTLLEQGLPGFETRGWNGLLGPAKMPAGVLQKLYEAVDAAAHTQAFRNLLAQMAFDPVDRELPLVFAERVRSDYEMWGSYVRKAKISLD